MRCLLPKVKHKNKFLQASMPKNKKKELGRKKIAQSFDSQTSMHSKKEQYNSKKSVINSTYHALFRRRNAKK